MATVEVKNALWGPLALELAEGRTVSLEPRRSAIISEEDFQAEGCQKALGEGKIFVLPSAQPAEGPDE
jgi:hypothetical protein